MKPMHDVKFFGPYARFEHIGIAVKQIAEISPTSETITDHIQRVSVAYILLNGIKIELIEPYGNNSPIKESLKKGVKLLHLCYEVPDIELTIKTCRKYGFHCISQPVSAIAYDGRRIAWVYSTAYGLVELLENSSLETQIALERQ